MMTWCPIFTLPAMPTCATSSPCGPIFVPWPTATRSLNLVPRPMTVLPSVARSMEQLAPISTSSSITTLPTCGILWCATTPSGPLAGANGDAVAEHAVVVDHDVRKQHAVAPDPRPRPDVDARVEDGAGADGGGG